MALRRAAFLSATTPGKLEQVAERTSKVTHRELVWASTEVKWVARGGRPTAVVITRARQPMKSISPAGPVGSNSEARHVRRVLPSDGRGTSGVQEVAARHQPIHTAARGRLASR